MIDYKKLAEPFDKKDWEWRAERAGVTNQKPWCLVVPYIQNRAIMDRLDAVCGANNWKNEYRQWRDNSQLCGISIFDADKNEWVTKWDGAEDTQFESTKGGLSASMKRAAVQWGIGRHLYNEKETYVECSLEKKQGWEKAQTKDKQDIWWSPNDPKLTGKGNDKPKSLPPPVNNSEDEFVLALRAIEELEALAKNKGVSAENLKVEFLTKFKVPLSKATSEQIRKAIKSLEAMK